LTSRYVWRVALIGLLCVALSTAANADQLQSDADHFLAAAIAVVAVVVVVTVVLINQASSNRTVTGCISSAPNGMLVTSEKDKKVYALTGDMTGVKLGDRMTLHLKKIKTKGSNTLTWETKKVSKDFGVCQPRASSIPSSVSSIAE
jgi:hypothetical protein